MHPPGYIQEGQETIFGYLLLGVYHRNSPGCTTAVQETTGTSGATITERRPEQVETAAAEGMIKELGRHNCKHR
jgi:hypothetical protein